MFLCECQQETSLYMSSTIFLAKMEVPLCERPTNTPVSRKLWLLTTSYLLADSLTCVTCAKGGKSSFPVQLLLQQWIET